MANRPSNPGSLHHAPRLNPITAILIGVICIPAGLVIKGGIGGGLVGGGIVSLLTGLWDILRIKMGLVSESSEKPSEPSNRDESTH